MFVNEDYIDDYKYLVDVSDNYYTLTNVSHASGSYEDPDEINVIYQYINPSPLVIECTQQVYSDVYYDNVSSQLSSDYWDRGDVPNIFFVQFFILLLFGWLLNQLSKLVHKGGVFGA